ncbi:MAG: TIGR00288 family NYN domain-containing protein [Candidatus Nanohaloarchaeota archaeon QJJ-7]|nr:TIGR00288 family NYN domain-containing protein [Candidatus Nanohaloarchaeota archaeon QJJ-7]
MLFKKLKKGLRKNNIAVFMDGPNVLRNEFDLDLDDFRERLEEDGTITVAKVFLNQYASEKLIEAVVSQGFEPVLGVGEVEEEESDVDVYMSSAAMEAVFSEDIDTIVLVTRDADFLPVVQKAKEKGKNVIVAGMEPGFSVALKNAADSVMLL